MTRDELMELGRKNHEAELACMALLGVISETSDMADIWMDIWPRVWRDRLVDERAETLRKANNSRASFVVEAVNEMSKTERIALRDRVLGVKEFPKSASAS